MIQKTRKIKRLRPTRGRSVPLRGSASRPDHPSAHPRTQNLKTVFFSIITIILILSFVGFLIFSNWRINQRRAELISQIKTLEKEIQEVEQKNQELKAGLSQLSDEDYLEKTARERLGLKKPGEEVVVVLPPPEKEEEKPEEKNFWQKILDPVRNLFESL